MAYCYFDETIRDRGAFIIGALVISDHDLSPVVSDEWKRLGLDLESNEYKSSDPKDGDELGRVQRAVMARLLHRSKLALTVCPIPDRDRLGEYCAQLVVQLMEAGAIADEDHSVYLDQGIAIGDGDVERLARLGAIVFHGSDSRIVGGIQVADHAAHALGGMLLEEIGVLNKRVRAGSGSGYHPDDLIELGFELWASLRYALIGRNEHIKGRTPPPEDPANPYFRVDGIGLHIAPTCPSALAESARARFGVNYLGCIH